MPFATPAHFLPLLEGYPLLPAMLLKSLPLLLIAWLLHVWLGKCHPQWRVYLWRATAAALLLLPLIGLIRLPLPAAAAQALRIAAPRMQVPDLPVADSTATRTDSDGNSVTAQPDSAADAAAVQPDPVVNAAAAQAGATATAQAHGDVLTAQASAVPPPATGETLPFAQSPQQPDARGSSSIIPNALYILWGAGCLIALCRLLAGAWATRTLLRRSLPALPHIQTLAQTIAADAGIRRLPAVRTTNDLQSPALCRVFAPALLLPSAIASRADERELRAILSHELAHLKARDPLWNLLIRLCAILYWPNPLAWRMRIAHLGACELLADAASARSSGGADAYSQILARIALAINGNSRAPGLSMARSAKVLHRIRRLPLTLAAAPLKLRTVACAFIAFALIAVAIGSTLVVQAATESPAPAQTTIASTPAAVPADTAVAALPDSATPAASATTSSLQQAHAADSPPPQAQTAALSAQQAGHMDVRIINTKGEPLDEATLKTEYSWKGPSPVTSVNKTGNGTFRITLEAQKEMPGSLSLYAEAAGYVPLATQWSPLGEDAMPTRYTFQMEPVTQIGGRVTDASGNGIADATVKVSLYQNSYPSGVAYPYLLQYPVTTDADGKWSCDKLPIALQHLNIEVTHPQYTSSNVLVPLSMYVRLRDNSWETTLRKQGAGFRLGGIVTFPDGSPAEGVQVRAIWRSAANDSHSPVVTTDAQGRYSFTSLRSIDGQVQLYLAKQGYAPQEAHIDLTGDTDDHDIRLKTGHAVRIKIVDPEGKPLEGVQISAGNRPFDELIKDKRQPLQTNAEGEWQWPWMPESVVIYNFYKEGYIQIRGFGISPPGQTITMEPVIRVEATVVDAQTGEPIPYFSVQEYRQQDPHWSSYWQPSSTFNSTDGKFGMTLDQDFHANGNGWRIGVTAQGYMQQEKRVTLADGNPVRLHYALERAAPVTGHVVSADGTPLADIEVKLVARKRGETTAVLAVDGSLQAFYPVVGQLITDTDGSFTFEPSAEDYMLVVLREDGYASTIYRSGSTDPVRLTLTPWAQISGQLLLNPGETPEGRQMMIASSSTRPDQLYFRSSALTDAQGYYSFNRVSQGENSLNYYAPTQRGKDERLSNAMSGPAIMVSAPAGGLAIRDYNAQGADLEGKLDWSALPPDYEWEIAYGRLNSIEQPNPDAEGETILANSISYTLSIGPDGTVRANGVKAGIYKLSIQVGNRDQPGEPWQSGITANAATMVTIPRGKPGAVFDAGSLKLQSLTP